MPVTATRRLEFDAAHRVTRHGGKCANLHGHRYAVEVTVSGEVPADGMVFDFGQIKARLGTWIDEHLDHGVILAPEDAELAAFCDAQGWKVYRLRREPTAENLARLLLVTADNLLPEVKMLSVRVYETPNCWAEMQA